MTEAAKPKRKTVKQVDVEQDATEVAIKELFQMIAFLSAHPNYRLEDYVREDHFKETTLAKIVGLAE